MFPRPARDLTIATSRAVHKGVCSKGFRQATAANTIRVEHCHSVRCRHKLQQMKKEGRALHAEGGRLGSNS